MKYLLLVIMPLAFFSCQKGISEEENPTINIQCDLLRQGMIASSILMISESLGPTLDNQYSNDNLNQIARDISANKYKSIRKAPFKTPHRKILRGCGILLGWPTSP